MVPTHPQHVRLKAARERADLTRAELASAMSPPVTWKTIEHWEDRRSDGRTYGGPTGEHRRQLAHRLGVPVFELFPIGETERRLAAHHRQLIASAHPERERWYFTVKSAADQRAVVLLVDLWVAEEVRPGEAPDSTVYRLTGYGEDVRDALGLAPLAAVD